MSRTEGLASYIKNQMFARVKQIIIMSEVYIGFKCKLKHHLHLFVNWWLDSVGKQGSAMTQESPISSLQVQDRLKLASSPAQHGKATTCRWSWISSGPCPVFSDHSADHCHICETFLNTTPIKLVLCPPYYWWSKVVLSIYEPWCWGGTLDLLSYRKLIYIYMDMYNCSSLHGK